MKQAQRQLALHVIEAKGEQRGEGDDSIEKSCRELGSQNKVAGIYCSTLSLADKSEILHEPIEMTIRLSHANEFLTFSILLNT